MSRHSRCLELWGRTARYLEAVPSLKGQFQPDELMEPKLSMIRYRSELTGSSKAKYRN